MRAHMQRFFKEEDGQAMVEFVLLLAMAISMLVLIRSSIKKVTVKAWSAMAARIAAPCADCEAEDDFQL